MLLKTSITSFLLMGVLGLLSQKNVAHNPIIFADVTDMSLIRVGDSYYMSSTTMHISPGLPIMKSKDLINWKLVSYCYDRLVSIDDMNLDNGKSTYDRGSWASSMRYHTGTFYVSTFAATSGKTHIYYTNDIEKGKWKEISFRPSLLDHSLYFDDDGKVYMLFGNKKLTLVELNADLSGIKDGGINKVVVENSTASTDSIANSGLGEGSQLFKINGKYYLFNITWPRGDMRAVVIHRAVKITGPYKGRIGSKLNVILQTKKILLNSFIVSMEKYGTLLGHNLKCRTHCRILWDIDSGYSIMQQKILAAMLTSTGFI